MLTVGKLRNIIEGVDDNTPVLVSGLDHSYRMAIGNIGTVLHKGCEWTEDFGEDYTPESVYGKRVSALLLD